MVFTMKPDHTKLFVGGISKETSEDTMREHFSKNNKVVESLIIEDKNTVNKKEIGYITFIESSMTTHKALDDQHCILDEKVTVDPTNVKTNSGSSVHNKYGDENTQINTKKIFVGGLPPFITVEEFKYYFQNFGIITDAVVMYDKEKKRSRGFGYITFDSKEAVDKVLKKSCFHVLNGKKVEVKRVEPKGKNNDNQNNYYNGGFGTWYPSSYAPWYPSYAPYYGSHPHPCPYHHPYHHFYCPHHCYCLYYYGWPAFYGCYEPISYDSYGGCELSSHGGYGLSCYGGDEVSLESSMFESFYLQHISDKNYVNDWANVAINKIGGDITTNVQVVTISSPPQIDDLSYKSNGNNDNGDLKLQVIANSLQIDNSSNLKRNDQKHQHGAYGQSKPCDSLLTPNGTLN